MMTSETKLFAFAGVGIAEHTASTGGFGADALRYAANFATSRLGCIRARRMLPLAVCAGVEAAVAHRRIRRRAGFRRNTYYSKRRDNSRPFPPRRRRRLQPPCKRLFRLARGCNPRERGLQYR